jgi:hypothetical protein
VIHRDGLRAPHGRADAVNLGIVVNVIEDAGDVAEA